MAYYYLSQIHAERRRIEPSDQPIEDIKRLNIEKHLGFIEQAAAQDVQILCMQEVFTTPYFCAEQQTRWYEAVERIPDGPTVRLLQEVAKAHGMVIIVPIYEDISESIVRTTFRTSTPASGRSSIFDLAISVIRPSKLLLLGLESIFATTGISPRALVHWD